MAFSTRKGLRDDMLKDTEAAVASKKIAGGARRDRTADLVIANDALSQLSYGPVHGRGAKAAGRKRRHLQSPPTASQEQPESVFLSLISSDFSC